MRYAPVRCAGVRNRSKYSELRTQSFKSKPPLQSKALICARLCDGEKLVVVNNKLVWETDRTEPDQDYIISLISSDKVDLMGSIMR